MSAPRRAMRLAATIGVAGLLMGCVDLDDEPLPPLRGLEDQADPVDADTGVAGEEIDLAGLGEDAAGPDQAAGGNPEGAGAREGAGLEPPPDFPDVPFEELDLPPDEPPPPIEASTPPPTQPAAPVEEPTPEPTEPASPEPQRGPPPPPPSEPLDLGALGAVDDYCQLWQTYGGYGALLDQALVAGPPDRTAATLTFGVALYQRSGALAPADLRSDFNQLAEVLGGLDSLLGEFGHDFMAFLSAADGDPQLLSRLQAVEAAAEQLVPRIDEHIFATCGVSIA